MKKSICTILVCAVALACNGCGTMLGAGVGGLAGGSRGAAIGALAGAALIDAPAIAAQQNREAGRRYVRQNCYYDQWNNYFCPQPEQQIIVYRNSPPVYPEYQEVFFVIRNRGDQRHLHQRYAVPQKHRHRR